MIENERMFFVEMHGIEEIFHRVFVSILFDENHADRMVAMRKKEIGKKLFVGVNLEDMKVEIESERTMFSFEGSE